MPAIDAMPAPERTFTGGVRTRIFNATYPLARLRVGGSGVRLTCMGFWRRSWTWEDLQAIEEVRGVLGSPGLRFVPRGGGPTIFWTFRPREVIGALRGAGAPVEEADQPLVFLGTGRRRRRR